MSDGTHIEWTDSSWNMLRARLRASEVGPAERELLDVRGWHCERVSPGCQNCYAEALNVKRFGTGLAYNRKSRDAVDLFLDEGALVKPLHWRKPRKVFVCSMTDLFGEWVPDEWIDRVFAVMALAPQHTFQCLSKRPARMRAYLTTEGREDAIGEAMEALTGRPVSGDPPDDSYDRLDDLPLPNVWVGASVEDQVQANRRIPELLATPAAVRYLSCEPLLERVDLSAHMHASDVLVDERIDWVIVGGESGPGARPMDIAWARSLVEQCRAAGVAVFVKQLGARVLGPDNPPALRRWLMDYGGEWTPPIIGPRATIRPENAIGWVSSSLKGGDMSEWPADLRVREFPV